MASSSTDAPAGPFSLDAIVQSVKDGYYALENRYYDWLDQLQPTIPVYNVVDPIDRVVPSFIVFSLLLLAILLGIIFVISGALFGGFTGGIHVVDADGLPIEGARVELLSEALLDNQNSWDTNADGFVVFHLSQEEEWTFKVSAPGYNDLTLTHSFSAAEAFVEAILSEEIDSDAGLYRLDVQDFASNRPIFGLTENQGKEGSARLMCESNGTVIAIVPIKESSIRLTALDNTSCASIQVAVTFPGYQPSASQKVSRGITTVSLKKVVPESVSLTVRALDGNSQKPLSGLKVIVTGAQAIAPQLTDSSGTTVFNLAPSTYSIRIVDEKAIYEQPADQTADLTDGLAKEKIFVLRRSAPSAQKKIFLRMKDANSGSAVLAWVSLYQDKVLLDTARSTNGDYTYALADGNHSFVYSAIVSHDDYVTKVLSPVTTRSLNDPKPTEVELVRIMADENGQAENAFQLNVRVLADNNSYIAGAHVQVFDKRYDFPLDQGDSLTNGLKSFYNLPPATYYATAETTEAFGKSAELTGKAGEIKDVNIQLIVGTVTVRATVVSSTGAAIADANVIYTTHLDSNQFFQLTSAQGIANGVFKVNRIVTLRVTKPGYETVELPPVDLHGLREPAVRNVRVVLFPVDAVETDLSLRLVNILTENQSATALTLKKGESYWLQYRLRAKDSSTNASAYVWVGKETIPISDASARITGVSSGATTHAYYSEAVANDPFNAVSSNLLAQPPAKRLVLNYADLDHEVAREFLVKVSIDNNAFTTADANLDVHYGAKTASPAVQTGDYVKSYTLGKPLCLVTGTNCPPLIILPEFKSVGSSVPLITANGFYELSADANYHFSYSIYNASNQAFDALSTVVAQSSPSAILLDHNSFVITGGLPPSQTALSPPFLAQALLESSNASFTILVEKDLPNDANRLLVPIKVLPKSQLRVDYSKLFQNVPYEQTLVVQVLDASLTTPVNDALVSASFDETNFANPVSATTDENGKAALLLDVASRPFVYLRVSAPGFEAKSIRIAISAFDPNIFTSESNWPCLAFQSTTGEDLESIHVTKDSRASFRVVSACENPVDVSLFVQTAPVADCYPSLVDESHGTEIQYANGQSSTSIQLSADNPSNLYRFTGNCLKGVYGIRIRARETGSDQEFTLGKRLLSYVDAQSEECFSLDGARFDLRESSSQNGVATNHCPIPIQNTLAPQFSMGTDLIGVARLQSSNQIPIEDGVRKLNFTVSNISGQDDVYSVMTVRDYVAKTTKLDVVFLLDSSTSVASLDPVQNEGSFGRAYQRVCDDINAVLGGLRSEDIVINRSVYGMGLLFGCASRVADWGDISVPYSKGPFNNLESWAPAAQFIINNHEWDPTAQRAIVIVSDNAPGGRNNDVNFSKCDGTADEGCFWPVESTSTIVQNTITAAKLKNVRIIISRLPNLEGLNGTLRHRYGSPDQLDVIEAMQDVADGTGGKLITYPVDQTASELYANEILNAIFPMGEERFHVLAETGTPACYGPTNLAGQAGPLAVPRVLWVWNWGDVQENDCSPSTLDGVQNPNYAYCDSAQFTTALLKRIHQMDIALQDKDLAEFNKRQSFLVALKKDGFTMDFRNDYNVDLTRQLLAGDGIEWFTNPTDGFRKLFLDPARFQAGLIQTQADYLTASEGYALDEPGIYHAQIVTSFIDPAVAQFQNNGSSNVIIKVHLTKVQSPQDNNPFYYLPFDGHVGLNEQTDQFERDGYGVSFTGTTTSPIYERVTPLYTLQAQSGTALDSGIQSNWNRQVTALNGPGRGVVLSAVYDSAQKKMKEVTFSPSHPTPVIVKVQGTIGESAGFGYLLKSNETGVEQVLDFPIATAPFVAQWTQVASSNRSTSTGTFACQNFDGSPSLVNQSDARLTSNSACTFNSTFNGKVFGLGLGAAQTADNYYRTIFYQSVGSTLSLQQTCKDSTVTFYSPAGSTTGASPILSLAYNPTGNGGPFGEMGDWKAIFDYAIKEVQVSEPDSGESLFDGYPLCVYKNADEIQFFWNNAYVNALSKTMNVPGIEANFCPLPAFVR